MALVLLALTGTTLAQRYDSRTYRKKPRTELSAKSKKGIEQLLGSEEASQSGRAAQTKKSLAQEKAHTERYRLEQEQSVAQRLDDEKREGETPDYMVRAMEAYRYTGDRNVKRFAEAVSEFQMQELRAQALENIDDPEKFNRYMAIISGKQYAPYSSTKDSGYVVNKSTGEISVGNPHAADMHDRQMKADTARKHAGAASLHAKNRERAERAASNASRTGSKQKQAASSGMTAAEYRQARARAVEADRPDLVRELDDLADRMGYR